MLLGQLHDETFSLACGGSARRWRTPPALWVTVNSRRLDKPLSPTFRPNCTRCGRPLKIRPDIGPQP